ncbi:PilN domain-containing protein [endosymbiont of Ridgeia piscesae]|jgi:type IV pilus assembly protein PilN|uniref:Type IV pilus assembly protein PilN n=1 Tax=endosymbiont of Ridgeia piscesae TaxID=54398 RepID=A0A0T5Z5S2_9GAMM|nr:PilN domain-containing protein [endosymbiont of Ridgeia piscesae]KRT58001.1 type IV pilus assembly protein PilN [endosymbiont of Ridgeia piscesae]
MARINLLPWREAERKKRQREFGFMLMAAVVVTVIAIISLHMHIQSLIAAQDSRNTFLGREIAIVEQQIKEISDLGRTKAGLLARMNIIQELQSSRPQIVHLFDELVATLPEGVYLTKVSQSGTRVKITGRAQSNARVSAFMRKIEASQWLGKPNLNLIENKEETGTGLSHFVLVAQQISQNREEEK